MTKAKVIKLLKQQGAEYAWVNHGQTFEAWLPQGKIWDNGYGAGIVSQMWETWDTASTFWESVFASVNAEVVDDDGEVKK
jgi:hypothetical protein